MTDADLRRMASEDGAMQHPDRAAAQELAREVLSLRADLDAVQSRRDALEAELARLAPIVRDEALLRAELAATGAAMEENARLRHDIQSCAEKLATASGHLGIVAARQPERFWTRTPPTVPGWWWWREASDWVEVIRRVAVWPTGCGLAVEALDDQEADFILTPHNVGGEWSGPLTPPTLVAPEKEIAHG